MLLRRTVIALCALVVVASVTPSPAAAQTDRAADVDARTLFAEGRAAYDEGRFEVAVRAFRRAYVLSPRPELLYNIGQAELRAGHDDRALQAFEGFLRQAPEDAPQRSEVQERVTVLRGMGVVPSTAPETEPTAEPEEAAPEEAAVTPVASDAQPSSGGDVAPWIVFGVGAAVLVAGGVMMGVGVSEAQRVTDAPTGSRWVDLQGAADNANILWGVGIGAAALGSPRRAPASSGVSPRVGSSSGETSGATARLRIGVGMLSIEGEA